MIDGLTLYAMFAVCFAIATAGFLLWTVGLPLGCRRYGTAVVVACLAMTVANALMANEILTVTTADGVAYPHARFIGYFVAFGAITWLLGATAGADRRLTAVLALAVYGLPGSVLAGWNLSGPAATVASGLVFVSIAVTVGLLVGPVSRTAASASGERRLLYGKLRNLCLLIWIVLPIVGVLSEQNLAILTSFAGIFLGSYMDLLLLIGVGVLVLRSPTALDQMAGRTASTGTTTDQTTANSAGGNVGTTADD